jgi:hypothetical protein
MERNTAQLFADIISFKYDFKKSKERSPLGYKFLSNYDLKNENEETRTDFRTIQWYQDNGYIILSPAYNMYDEEIENYVAVYSKIDKGELNGYSKC